MLSAWQWRGGSSVHARTRTHTQTQTLSSVPSAAAMQAPCSFERAAPEVLVSCFASQLHRRTAGAEHQAASKPRRSPESSAALPRTSAAWRRQRLMHVNIVHLYSIYHRPYDNRYDGNLTPRGDKFPCCQHAATPERQAYPLPASKD